MKPIITPIVAGLALSLGAGLVGCASPQPPRELVDARAAYQQAVQTPGAYAAQTDIYDAKRSLDRAEASFKDHPKDVETRDLAYVAQRKALSARAKSEAMNALQQRNVAENEANAIQQQQRMALRSELERAKGELGASQERIESERRAREAADQRMRDALQKIAGVKAEEQDRGLVLTLSGGILFPFGKSTLLPNSQKALTKVAELLRDDQRNIHVTGHTDSIGSEETNMKLSEERAASVKKFLVAHGVPGTRIETDGMGKDAPIADNSTPEGRANNRRVEIVLERGSSSVNPSGIRP